MNRSNKVFRRLISLIVPFIPRSDWPPLLGATLVGTIIAGVYGILHDQITFSIGPEYFFNFKFHQFSHSNYGFPDRVFVAIIGFEATWWVGAIVGWILGRKLIPNQKRSTAYRQIRTGLLIVFASGILFGLGGYAYGLWKGPDGDYSHWHATLIRYRVSDRWSFMRVAYIHNASYIGGLVGLILTYVFVRPKAILTKAENDSDRQVDHSESEVTHNIES